MPEGDTIFRAARTLNSALAGEMIVAFESVLPALTRVHDDTPLTGRTIERVVAAGKHLLMHFSGGLVLRTHMRMNGSWHIYRAGERWQRSRGDMRIVIATRDFVAVAFNVPIAEMIPARDLARHRELRQLGPDLLGPEFDAGEALGRLRARPDAAIADALLNQRVLAGIGNVYKSEILFVCRINPFALGTRPHRRGARGIDPGRAQVPARKRGGRSVTNDDVYRIPQNDATRRPERASLGVRSRTAPLSSLRNAHRRPQTGSRRAAHVLVPGLSVIVIWIALSLGAAASVAALWGHYGVLPGWLTGPEICRLEHGGCAVLFRSPRAALLGIPNAALGVLLYAIIAAGLVLGWPPLSLFIMTLPAVAMSAFLGASLIRNRLQCRICWTGHIANAALAVLLWLRV